MKILNACYEIIVNGKTISCPAGKTSIEEKTGDEAIYVPLEFCSEVLEARVEWEANGKTVAIHRNGQTLKMQLGENWAEINGERQELWGPVVEINGELQMTTYPHPYLWRETENIYVLLQIIQRGLGISVQREQGKALISDLAVLALDSRPASIISPSIRELAGQKKDILFEDVSRLIDHSGLDRVKEDIKDYLLESVRIRPERTEEAGIRVGESKIAGIPHLPSSVEWPSVHGIPLSFIAQLNMEELAAILPNDQFLPSKGWLYFFYDNVEQPWGYSLEHREQWKVLFFDGDPALLEKRAFPDELPDYCRFMPYRLQLQRELCIPSVWSIYYYTLKLSREELESYLQLEQEIAGLYGDLDEDTPVYRVLGHPDIIQNDMQLECQQVSDGFEAYKFDDPQSAESAAKAWEWMLLLQVDSDESNNGMMWGDCGRLYFWIPREALRARDFQQVWTILECS